MAAHALLSASASHRWLNCPASVRLTEHIPDQGSNYAIEGSMAHEIAELKAKAYFEGLSKRAVTNRLKIIKGFLKYDGFYSPEMDGQVETYVDYLKECTLGYQTKPYAVVEKKVDYSNIAPGGFGTCDCLLVGSGLLTVIDFKYGKGLPVSALNNTQLMLYAIGAVNAYQLMYPIDRVKMVIVQPRLDSISEFEMTVDDLLAWGESIKPIAQEAFNGGGEVKPGEHCRFCKIKGNCKARAEANTAHLEFVGTDPNLLTFEEVGHFLNLAQTFEPWLKDIKAYALSKSLAGETIPGWKVVAGRGSRQFTDQDQAFEILKNEGVDEALLYERKALTLSAIEKMIGKKRFDETIGAFVLKSDGAPTLVPESDKRPAIQGKPTAEEAFKDIWI